jgi:hypothetical protein
MDPTGRPASRLNRADPQRPQNPFSHPPSGAQTRTSASPATKRNAPGTIAALTDAEVPVRRWQRVQWQ